MKKRDDKKGKVIPFLKFDLKMKLTTLFLFTAFFNMLANNGYAQSITLDAENVTIAKVIDKIETTSEYRFVYNIKFVDVQRKVSIKVEKAGILKVLENLFGNTQTSYMIRGTQIVLRNKRKTTTALENHTVPDTQTQTQIQTPTITGTVTDANGLPLIGANILEKGTLNGTQTDFDGNFLITVVDNNATLEISYIGFFTTEIIVGDQTVINVVMKESSAVLEEVVVTGYQTISKERATGSFEKVNEEILDVKLNQNILTKLQGEVPGLLFGGADDVGNEDSFIIRGLSSINGNTDPLVVVDGFPVEGGISTINPNDVKSVTILKDAAAASIWGIRAANGVIVIVTKKGARNKKLKVDISHSTAFTPKPDLTDNPLGSPATQVAYQKALFDIGKYDQSELFSGTLDFGSYRQLNPVVETLLLQQRGDITQAEADAQLQQLANTDVRKEYADLILRPVRWDQYNLAFSGGSEKHDFRTSITYNHNENGNVVEKADQIIVNFSNSLDLSPKLKARTSFNFSQSKTNNAPDETGDGSGLGFSSTIDGILDFVPTNSRILDSNGNYLPMRRGDNSIGQSANALASQLALDNGFSYPWTYNTKQEFDNANNVDKNTELRLQAALDYELFKDFGVSLSYQYEWGKNNARNLYNENTIAVRDRVNLFTQIDDNGIATEKPIPDGSILDLGLETMRAQTFRAQFNYDTNFKDDLHKLTLIGGYEARKTIVESTTDRKYGFNDETLINIRPDFVSEFTTPLSGGFGQDPIPENSNISFIENRFLSYFANGAYTLNNRYTLSASTRLDDTNLFGASDKFRNIPLYSVGVKWNIGNEGFFNTSKVSTLQLRATYGTNGNVVFGTSPFLQAVTALNSTPFNNFANFVTSLPNPELRLEKTRTVNLGLDFGFWDQRLNGSLEYYKKDSEDLLANAGLNPTFGTTGILKNIGKLSNEGIDVNLNIGVINTDKFNYNTTFNFSLNTNKLVRVDVQESNVFLFTLGLSNIEGNPLRNYYSANYAGLDKNGAPQFVNENGDIIDSDTNISDVAALINEGTVVPKYYGSWINNISYKQLSLRILTTFKAGHIFRYAQGAGFRSPSFNPDSFASENVAEDFNDRWQVRGDENRTDIPGLPGLNDVGVGYTFYTLSDKFIDSAAHIRLNQVSLGYSFSQNVLNKLAISNLQIGLQADNLAVWTFNKWDVDPENLFIPRQPTITLNINATF